MKKVAKRVALAMAIVGLLSIPVLAGTYAGFQVGPNFSAGSNTTVDGFRTINPTFNTGVMVGAQVGYDFLGTSHKFPVWTKYTLVALDYQFNTANPNNTAPGFRTGNQNALAILGGVKYPLMVNKDYPNGRLFPYLLAGPAVVWSNFANRTSTNVGVAIEPGIRYMLAKNISGDLAYRFRYATPSFNIDNANLKMDNFNHTVLARVNFHFANF